MSGSPPTEPDRDPEASTADRRSPAQIHDESVAALVESPDDPVRLAALADSIRRMGAGATARPVLQRAIELHQPSTARWTSLRIQLARLCHHEGLIEESLELLDGLDWSTRPHFRRLLGSTRPRFDEFAGLLDLSLTITRPSAPDGLVDNFEFLASMVSIQRPRVTSV